MSSDALEHFRQQMDKSRDACLKAVAAIPGALAHVPSHLLSERMCVAAVACDGRNALKLTPEALRTKAVCDAALAKDPMAIMHVPLPLIDALMAMHVASRSGNALAGIPTDLRDATVCRLAANAMEADASGVLAFPEWVYTALSDPTSNGHAIMNAAFERAPDALSQVLTRVAVKDISDDLLMASVRRWGFTLVHVPPDRRTEPMHLAAVTACGAMLAHVPGDDLSRELCEAAIRASVREAWGLAPGETMDAARGTDRVHGKLRYTAVEATLAYVPAYLRDEALCLAAIEATPENAEWVPDPVWSSTLAEALGHRARDDQFAEWVPEKLRDVFFDAVDATSAPRFPMPKGMQW